MSYWNATVREKDLGLLQVAITLAVGPSLTAGPTPPAVSRSPMSWETPWQQRTSELLAGHGALDVVRRTQRRADGSLAARAPRSVAAGCLP